MARVFVKLALLAVLGESKRGAGPRPRVEWLGSFFASLMGRHRVGRKRECSVQ